MNIALIADFHNIFLNDMMHTGLITAGLDMLPITANGDNAEQATASASNMINRGLDNLPLKHKKPQGILSYFYSAWYYPVIFFKYLDSV